MSTEVTIIQDQDITVTVTGDLITVNVVRNQTIDGVIQPATQAQVNTGTATEVYVDPSTLKNADQSTSIAFNAAITCSNKNCNYMTAPAGNLSFTKASTGHVNFGNVLCYVASEVGRTLTFSTGFLENNSAASNYDDTHDCNILFWKSPLSNKINYSIIDLGEAADVTAPTLSAFAVATATPNRVTFNSSEAITGTTFAGFTITGKSITSINIAAGQTTGHYFVVNSNFIQGSAYTIAYNGNDDWEDTADVPNALASFGATAITNNVDNPDITAASVENAAPSNFVFTAERAITGTTAGWTPKINGVAATKTGFSGSGTTTITITVSETVVNGDVLTFDYSGGDMVDEYGNVMQTISGQSVTNNVAVAGPIDIVWKLPSAEASVSGSNLSSSGSTGFAAYAEATTHLDTSAEGYVQSVITTISPTPWCLLLFNATDQSANYTSAEYGIMAHTGGNYYKVTSGVPANLNIAWQQNDIFRIGRFSGNVKIQYSRNSGETWTDLFDFGAHSEALYINGNVYTSAYTGLKTVKGYGLI